MFRSRFVREISVCFSFTFVFVAFVIIVDSITQTHFYFSAYGDGWGGVFLSVYDCEGNNRVFHDQVIIGNKDVEPLCIPDDGTGGSFVYSAACELATCAYSSEVSWTIYDSSKTAIASGGPNVASTTYGDCGTHSPATPTILPSLSRYPSEAPTRVPTPPPTQLPTARPTHAPTHPPTMVPTPMPTYVPYPPPSPLPSMMPFPAPSATPSLVPTMPTFHPTAIPTHLPTHLPTPSDRVATTVIFRLVNMHYCVYV
jgi:hypothetical protein